MDFGTITQKLQDKQYSNDLEFMSDAALVFENCYRYNHDDDAVARYFRFILFRFRFLTVRRFQGRRETAEVLREKV
jgi:hypothetical protein